MSVADETMPGQAPAPQLSEPLAGLYANSRAAEFALGPKQFLQLLSDIAAKHASEVKFEEFCSTLRVEDLVLARACAAGNERAWEVFMLRFREKLYDVARQITREDSSGRELADCIYADLYGTKVREEERVSKLRFYNGRGSLDGWLRTVLAQEYVNTYRKQRRLVSLDEESEEGVQFAAPERNDAPPPILRWRGLPMTRCAACPRKKGSFSLPISWTTVRWRTLRGLCVFMNRPSAARSRNSPRLCASRS
jgi:hypothetical protein